MCSRSCAIARCIARCIPLVRASGKSDARPGSRRGIERVGYDVEGKSEARMVESADTADLKSADHNRSWGFKSPSGHHKALILML
jgi:hypothetical protein